MDAAGDDSTLGTYLSKGVSEDSRPRRSTSTETVHCFDSINSPLHLVDRQGRLCVDTAALIKPKVRPHSGLKY
jgi:hypothetical protein